MPLPGMKKIFWFKRFKDVSISRKLYFTVGIMALLIGVELFALFFSINTLSSVRAYVEGEGLWSKAQKDGIYHLVKYGDSHNEADYQEFLRVMKVPLGDSKARQELGKANPNIELARKGFIEGRNAPSDVDGMISLFRNFSWISYIHKAIILWTEAEPYALQLLPIGEKLHNEINSGSPSQQKIDELLKETDPINQKVTVIEDEFSYTLGEGSRWLEGVVLKLLFCIALTVEITGLLLAISVSRGIQKGLDEIINAAMAFSKGNLKAKARVFSNDEIGVLANSFNEMSEQLRINIDELRNAEEKLMDSFASLQKSQSEIQALNESLELKVTERTFELQEAYRGLESFSYSVSHDLRAPLRTINGFSQILVKNHADSLDTEAKEFLDLISSNAVRMSTLIDGMLKLSRYDRGPLSKSKVDIHELVNRVVEEIRITDKELKAEIIVAPLYEANCDPVLVKQVWVNLISNAVKYSSKKQNPRIEIGSAIENGMKYYYVKDNGAGFDMKQASDLFGAFKRLHRADEFEGIGIGLAVVHRIVNKHGGKVWVNAEIDKGATFHFTLS